MAVLGEEDTEELQVFQVAFEKAERLSKVPLVEHQIKATEEFIGRAKRSVWFSTMVAIQNAQESLRTAESLKEEEVKRLSEAEEALQRLMVHTPVVPSPPPRSVEALQRMVEQLQIERDALAGQVKHQNSTRMMEKMHPVQGSEDAAQIVLERSAKRRALGEDIHTDQQDLEGWLVSKQLELRDALEMGEIGIIKELTVACKGSCPIGGFPFNGFQHGCVKQVPTDFGADGAASEWVRLQTQDPYRLAAHAGWQRPFKIPATVFEGQLRSQNVHSQTASAADW